MIQVTETKHGGRVIILDEKDQLPSFLKPGMIAIGVVDFERDVFTTPDELRSIADQVEKLMKEQPQPGCHCDHDNREVPVGSDEDLDDIIRRLRTPSERVAAMLAKYRESLGNPEDPDPEDPRPEEEARERGQDEHDELAEDQARAEEADPDYD